MNIILITDLQKCSRNQMIKTENNNNKIDTYVIHV